MLQTDYTGNCSGEIASGIGQMQQLQFHPQPQPHTPPAHPPSPNSSVRVSEKGHDQQATIL